MLGQCLDDGRREHPERDDGRLKGTRRVEIDDKNARIYAEGGTPPPIGTTRHRDGYTRPRAHCSMAKFFEQAVPSIGARHYLCGWEGENIALSPSA